MLCRVVYQPKGDAPYASDAFGGSPFKQAAHLVALAVDAEMVVDEGAHLLGSSGMTFVAHFSTEDVAAVEEGGKGLLVLGGKVVDVVEGDVESLQDAVDA